MRMPRIAYNALDSIEDNSLGSTCAPRAFSIWAERPPNRNQLRLTRRCIKMSQSRKKLSAHLILYSAPLKQKALQH
jgi:hypothetical protein